MWSPAPVLLPEGFGLPPAGHLAALLAAVAFVAVGLYRRRPRVDDRVVLGFAPWIAVGSCLHVLFVVDALPDAIAPFAGTPAVYLSVAAVAAGVWLALEAAGVPVPLGLATTGTLAVLPPAGAAVRAGAAAGTLAVLWPAVALAVSTLLAGAVWVALVRLHPAATPTGGVGLLVVFGHALDAVSTAVGVDVFDVRERTPLSRWVLEIAGGLPTADLLGAGWLFVAVKLAIAAAVVVLFADYVDERPREGYLLLGFVAAVGLGPGVHNVVLFATTGG